MPAWKKVITSQPDADDLGTVTPVDGYVLTATGGAGTVPAWESATSATGDSGNSAIWDNAGTPTLKSGITQAEMATALGYEAGADVNVGTNLSFAANTSGLQITSSTGSDVSVPAATSSAYGCMTHTQNDKLAAIEASATADQTASEVTALLATQATFALGSAVGGIITVNNDLTVTGDLLVSGDTVTMNVGTLVVEDKRIELASGAASVASASDAGIRILTTDATQVPELNWTNVTGQAQWGLFQNGNATSYPISTITKSNTTPSTEAGAGVGSFHFEEDAGDLYIRVS